MVTRPAVPPYSSSTIAMCTLRRWRLWSRSSTLIDSGTNSGARTSRPMGGGWSVALEVGQQVLGVQDAHDVVDAVLVDRDARVAALHDGVHDLVERRGHRQRHDVDARHHHLVDAALAELQHGADHLLLLGLDDALLAAPLDEDHQLLGRDPVTVHLTHAEDARDGVGDGVEHPHDRREDAAQDLDRAGEQERIALGVGQRQRLGHQLAEDGRDEGHRQRDQQQAMRPAWPAAPGRLRARSASASAMLAPAKAAARKPTKVMPSCRTARNRPGWETRRSTRRALCWPSSMSCWRRLLRTVTRAISAATKRPLSTMSTRDDERARRGRPSAGPGLVAGLHVCCGSRGHAHRQSAGRHVVGDHGARAR